MFGMRYSMKSHQFQIAVREYQRQARDAVSQAVQESSENHEVMIMQEIQGIQNRSEEQMEENERRLAQMIGSEAPEAKHRRIGPLRVRVRQHQIDFEALDPKIAKGIMKTFLVQEKDQFLGGDSIQEQMSNANR